MLSLHAAARRAALPAVLAWSALPGSAGAQDTLRAGPPAPAQLVTIGGDEDDRQRVDQLVGLAPTSGYLLRTPSSRSAPLPGGAGALRWALLAPELSLWWNSALPFSQNDGAVWAGKGVNGWVMAGARVEFGRFFAVLAPQVGVMQNQGFAPLLPESMREELTFPWYGGQTSADLPLRFGEETLWSVDPGQSSLGVRLGGAALGASTENQWWGPGIRNAIVMSNNAPGIPHLFLRTASPWRTRAGALEGRLIIGALGESGYFDRGEGDGTRSLSGAVATFSPAAEPDLTLGIARTVQSAVDGVGEVLPRAADVFFRWPDSSPDSSDARAAQILSLFGRWVFPRDGLEVYAEWARHELPEDFGDFLEYPNHTQGYTLGMQWAGHVAGPAGSLLRLQTELTYLEQSSTFRVRPVRPYYTSAAVPQGYTHRGQVIGAAIGPGASSQWLAADYLAGGARLGLFGGRVRWDNDAYLETPRALIGGWGWLGHDVSLFGGVRAGYRLGAVQVGAELATGQRYNYLFQNTGKSWESADDAVDVRNHTLRLSLTPVFERARAEARLPPPPAAPPAAGAARADSLAAALPAASAAPAPSPDSAAPAPAIPADSLPRPLPVRTHVVQAGETLSGIARRYGVLPEAIRAANQLAGDAVRAGQELVIPGGR